MDHGSFGLFENQAFKTLKRKYCNWYKLGEGLCIDNSSLDDNIGICRPKPGTVGYF